MPITVEELRELEEAVALADQAGVAVPEIRQQYAQAFKEFAAARREADIAHMRQIGRASCRERVSECV